ncbi:JAB domain-containing protein [Pseudothauera rhizosphaerae]|uniref:MPN domain-containing protein n=1 Tax=Pseudothauera rhizosphaerae TaxID=2565932 RepID=A0A4S4AAI8_9RHOO|nr:JAB domain-containing protein [Pseudothauera rhizosphaerae]THF55899.1 hypothetical protein E6O51_20145 [Pseudothauera rhizosphaerae]
MTRTALGAPAPESPSVFTTHEARTIRRALDIIEEKRLRNAPVLYYFEDFQRYLTLRFAGLANEQGHVLYLDVERRLLAAETEFFGDHKRVPWDIRRVALRAITLGADSVVYAHNHPNDNPTPSEPDVRHLTWQEGALSPLNITLLDSYVVTSRGITSIKDYRKRQQEEDLRLRMEQADRWSAERRAKIAATKARKAAERAAQRQGEAA